VSKERLDTAASLAAIGRFDDAEAILKTATPEEGAVPAELILKLRISAQRGDLDAAEGLLVELEQLDLDQAARAEIAELGAAIRAAKGKRDGARRRVHPVIAVSAVVCLVALIGFGHWLGRQSTLRRIEGLTTQRLLKQTEGLVEEIKSQQQQIQELSGALGTLRADVAAQVKSETEESGRLRESVSGLGDSVEALRRSAVEQAQRRNEEGDRLRTRLEEIVDRLEARQEP